MTSPPRRETVDLLLATFRQLVPESDVKKILVRVMEVSVQILRADRALLFLYDEQTEALVFKYGVNIDEGLIEDAFQFSSNMIERAMQGEIIIIDDSNREGSTSITESIFKYDIKSILCAPIMSGGKLIGVIYADTRGKIAQLDDELKRYFLSFVEFVGDVITKSFEFQEKDEELTYLKRRLAEESLFPDIVGRSAAIDAVKQKILRITAIDYPVSVLIIGESGSGKELIARAIHQAGTRSAKPYVAVNCAAIPAALLESELFGHERGAFTGAHTRKPGFFEVADGGVIFLDEIGDLIPELQPKLLRVLQFGTFTRIGGRKDITVDVQVICATSKDLNREMAEGRFRQSLFHRLAVDVIRVPPLRERREDILLLANRFMKYFSQEMGKPISAIDTTAQKLLRNYDYSSNNVRELKNICERAILHTEGPEITEKDIIFSEELLEERDRETSSPPADDERWDYLTLHEEHIQDLLETFRDTDKNTKEEKPFYIITNEIERKLILLSLRMCDWKIKPAARLLGISHLSLRSKLGAVIEDVIRDAGGNLERARRTYEIPLDFLRSKRGIVPARPTGDIE